MKILKLKSILFSLMAITVVTVFLTSCEKDAIEESLVTQNEQVLITDYEKAEEILGDYIVERNGTFVLTENDPIKLGIDPVLFRELEKGFNTVNTLIKNGEIKSEWIGKTIDPETLEVIEIVERGCNVNEIHWGWTSAIVYMSTDTANWLSIVGCGAGGGLVSAGVCSAIVQYYSQFVCTCGYRYHMIFYKEDSDMSCQ